LSQRPTPFGAPGDRLTPISSTPALPARSPFTHFGSSLISMGSALASSPSAKGVCVFRSV
jgi:hypothetical protein